MRIKEQSSIASFKLSGYIFFGSSQKIAVQVESALNQRGIDITGVAETAGTAGTATSARRGNSFAPSQHAAEADYSGTGNDIICSPLILVFDWTHVTGMDASGAARIMRLLVQLTTRSDITAVVFGGLQRGNVHQLLMKMHGNPLSRVHIFADWGAAMTWAEQALLLHFARQLPRNDDDEPEPDNEPEPDEVVRSNTLAQQLADDSDEGVGGKFHVSTMTCSRKMRTFLNEIVDDISVSIRNPFLIGVFPSVHEHNPLSSSGAFLSVHAYNPLLIDAHVFPSVQAHNPLLIGRVSVSACTQPALIGMQPRQCMHAARGSSSAQLPQ
ncbi:hypothetical protein CYMTET_27514 [Cymbomonas tetramitiformis]|uniref:STAS domain-containing protein n=1 Tax=Cymbomonas tetramitiformis TaxID=36881 RepID=A0AAE0FPL2_9CHLO|nr:hypothetical protein CYMTET_27514 [Cymbomonas tetramitiformis]